MSMSPFLQDIAYNFTLLKEIIYPRKCAVCHCNIDDGCFCDVCRQEYLLMHRQSFAKTKEALWRYDVELVPSDVLSEQVLLFKYDGAIKDGLHKLKFAAEYNVLPLLREEMAMAMNEELYSWVQSFDYACCIPTSQERLQQRGFDIPQELFNGVLAKGLCLYVPTLLERVKHTDPLFELNKEQRRQELHGCFALADGFDIKGRSVLLCDDIYTTGSTFTEAAAVLLQAGAASVGALAFAAAKENW